MKHKLTLSDHLELLRASAISDDVIRDRGYWTATLEPELADLGFAPFQQIVPALVIPIRDLQGAVVSHQIRPNNPRLNRDGKAIKYESPYGAESRLDVPLSTSKALARKRIKPALWVTEGAKKVDAAVSAGLVAVGIPGVWGFKKNTSRITSEVIADLNALTPFLHERQVVIAFDADAISNPSVHEAMRQLGLWLEDQGASALYAKLPEIEGDHKAGLDDYFAAGGTVEQLWDKHILAELPRRKTPDERFGKPGPKGGAPVPSPKENGRQGTGAKLRKLDLADLASREPEPIPWKIDKLAAKGELTMIFGIGGIAKSLTMLALSNGVIHGDEVAGIECHFGSAIYLDGENGEREIHRRVRGLGLSADMALYEVTGLNLNDPEDFAEIERIIAAKSAISDDGFVAIFDSLRTLLPGAEENDSGEMSRALTKLRMLAQRYDVAIVVIHHADKLGRTFRGSSAIRDQVSLSFKLGREKDDPDRRRRFLETDKFRIGDEPERRWFRLVIEPPQIYVEAAEAPDPDSKEAPQFPPLAEAILALFDDDGNTSMTLKTIAEALDKSPKNGYVRRVLIGLVEDRQLSKKDHDYERCPHAAPLGKHDEGHRPADDPQTRIAEPNPTVPPSKGTEGTNGLAKGTRNVDLNSFKRPRPGGAIPQHADDQKL